MTKKRVVHTPLHTPRSPPRHPHRSPPTTTTATNNNLCDDEEASTTSSSRTLTLSSDLSATVFSSSSSLESEELLLHHIASFVPPPPPQPQLYTTATRTRLGLVKGSSSSSSSTPPWTTSTGYPRQRARHQQPTLSSCGMAGKTSPSAVALTRKMSTALVTSSSSLVGTTMTRDGSSGSSSIPDINLPTAGGGGGIDSYLEGRPTCLILKEKMNTSTVTPSTQCGSTDEEDDDYDDDDSLFQHHKSASSSSSPLAQQQQQQQRDSHCRAPPDQGVGAATAAAVAGGAGHHKSTTSLCKPSLQRAVTMPADVRRSNVSGEFLCNPAPMRLEAWSETLASTFDVRSKTYLRTGIKVKSEASVFDLLTVDMVKSSRPIFTGLCAHPQERVQRALRREQETGQAVLPPFVFALNICIPGGGGGGSGGASNSNGAGVYYHCVAYFGCHDPSVLTDPKTAFGRLANKFLFGRDDAFRNETFKLIPRVVEGNFIVKKAVGTKPSILGKKLKQYYIQNRRYFELVLDIGSDAIAQRIVKLAQGYAKTLHVDMMVVLEGTTEATLPERILGGFRLKNVDFKELDGKRTVSSPTT